MPQSNDVHLNCRAPRDIAEPVAHSARFYGRQLSEELRLALRIHARVLALDLLRRNQEVRADAGAHLEELIAEHEASLERLCAESFTRPGVEALVAGRQN